MAGAGYFARRRDPAGGKEGTRQDHRSGSGRGRGCEGRGGLLPHVEAAVLPGGITGLGSGCAATVRGPMRPLQADSIRRKQTAHQQDGHRRALENASHEGSLPRRRFCGVIQVTGQTREQSSAMEPAQTPKIRHVRLKRVRRLAWIHVKEKFGNMRKSIVCARSSAG